MINSRSIADLIEPVQDRANQFLAKCMTAGIDIIVTSTYRDLECQERLYAQGRLLAGPIVTWAGPGDSWHNWQRAFDVVPLRNGKPIWSIRGLDKTLWEQVGELGVSCGLEWGGNWDRHPDYTHFQDKTGRTLYGLKKEAGLIK